MERGPWAGPWGPRRVPFEIQNGAIWVIMGAWGTGWAPEGSFGVFGVGFGAPGLDLELHFGTFWGPKSIGNLVENPFDFCSDSGRVLGAFREGPGAPGLDFGGAFWNVFGTQNRTKI